MLLNGTLSYCKTDLKNQDNFIFKMLIMCPSIIHKLDCISVVVIACSYFSVKSRSHNITCMYGA